MGDRLFTRMQWDLLEHKLEMDHYYQEHGDPSRRSSPPGETIPMEALRRPVQDITEGYVTERRCGRYVERRVRRVQSSGGNIRRLPFEYPFGDDMPFKPYVLLNQISVDYETGEEIMPPRSEWKWCRESESRMADPKQVRRTCENFKWLLRANERHIRLFVTLTYAENMTDTKRLYQDYRRFVQRLRRAYPAIDGYLVAFEPQKRGAWHAHVLLISSNAFLRISNKEMHRIWGYGFTKVQGVRKIRDIGSYLTSYLTNVKSGKTSKKGARLGMYPRGFHFLRASRDGVSRIDVSKWFGRFDQVSFPGEVELLYDYEHRYALDKASGIYQVTKIFCFREKGVPPD